MAVKLLESKRVARAKRAFTTRRVGIEKMQSLLTGAITPQPGDLVLARVDEIGKHKRIELTDGRRAHMFPGDEIILCFGNRYAPDQFEAVIGVDLSPCDLVAAGGIASRELSRNQRMIPPTRITPIGLVGDRAGNRLNLRRFRLPVVEGAATVPTVVSVGTSMNAGKTLAATSLVRGLKSAGYRVAALKVTGTGAGGDLWIVKDAGADVVLDFTDAGFASTYLVPIHEIEEVTRRLISHAARLGCDIAVIEIADGLEHSETAGLIRTEGLWSDNLGMIFAAYDAMGAKRGTDMLTAAGHRVLALSGRLAISPLAVREAERATGLRVYGPWELQEGGLNAAVIARAHEVFAANPMFSLASSFANHGFSGLFNDRLPNADCSMHRSLPEDTKQDGVLTSPLRASQPQRDVLDDGLRSVLGFIAKRVMTVESDALCGANIGAVGSKRINRRNGYRHRRWRTGLGPIDVKVPRLRQGGYRPQFLTKCTVCREDVKAFVDETASPDAAERTLQRLLKAMGVATLPDAEVQRLSADIQREEGFIAQASVMGGNLPPGGDDLLIANTVLNSNDTRVRDQSQLPGGYDEGDEEDDFHVAANGVKGPLDPVPDWQIAGRSGFRPNLAEAEEVRLSDELEAD